MSLDQAIIFDLKRDCSEDGPGIRTTVFFKGCPLSCVWCHNPEGKDLQPILSFDASLCRPTECGVPCLSKCENGSIQKDQSISIDHLRCTSCMSCCQVCPQAALSPIGRKISVDELLYELLIDQPFYQSTGGGVTLSGGEATMQMSFAARLLKDLKSHKIHTALETLVPEITATRENLAGLAGLLRKHQMDTCFLMPYNPLWLDKITRLGIHSSYGRSTFMSAAEQAACVEQFNSLA